jgi:hypothetical protein
LNLSLSLLAFGQSLALSLALTWLGFDLYFVFGLPLSLSLQ